MKDLLTFPCVYTRIITQQCKFTFTCKKPEIRTSERNYNTNQKTYRWYMNVLGSTSLTHGVSKQHAYLISYLTNKVDCLYLMSTVAIYTTLLYNNHLLSAYSAEVEPRIKIFMLKLVCGQNFVLFGHSGHELQRFENLVFSKFIWNCRCSDVYNAAAYSIQCDINYMYFTYG